MWCTPIVPALGRQGQRNCEFKDSLGYTLRPWISNLELEKLELFFKNFPRTIFSEGFHLSCHLREMIKEALRGTERKWKSLLGEGWGSPYHKACTPPDSKPDRKGGLELEGTWQVALKTMEVGAESQKEEGRKLRTMPHFLVSCWNGWIICKENEHWEKDKISLRCSPTFKQDCQIIFGVLKIGFDWKFLKKVFGFWVALWCIWGRWITWWRMLYHSFSVFRMNGWTKDWINGFKPWLCYL